MAVSPFLVVGLGNPGAKYSGTRHNIGFDAMSALASELGTSLDTKRFSARIGKGRAAGGVVWMCMPQTYMNRSGDSVGPMAGFHRIPKDRVLVLHDDIDLPLGRVTIKRGGGHGGHNGLRDISKALGGGEYPRVRIGVGRPEGPMETADWVLARFTPNEREQATQAADRAVEAVLDILTSGLDAAMNTFNRRRQGPSGAQDEQP